MLEKCGVLCTYAGFFRNAGGLGETDVGCRSMWVTLQLCNCKTKTVHWVRVVVEVK